MATPDPDPGRSFGWRLGMAAVGALAAGAGVAVVLYPYVLRYAIGGVLALVGLFFVASAVLARGR